MPAATALPVARGGERGREMGGRQGGHGGGENLMSEAKIIHRTKRVEGSILGGCKSPHIQQ